MSEELRHKLDVYRATKQTQALLSTIDGLEFVGFIESTQDVVPFDAFRDVYRIDAQPFSRLAIDASQTPMKTWLRMCLEYTGIQDTYDLELHVVAYAPWAQVHVSASEDWLVNLCSALGSYDVVIVPPSRALVLVFSEEEYYYEAHMRILNQPT